MQSNYLLVLFIVIFATTAKSACLDDIESKPTQKIDHTLPLNKWPTSELLTLASLVEEQQQWILTADVIANNIPTESLKDVLDVNPHAAMIAAKDPKVLVAVEYDKLQVPEEQKTKGLNLYFGLYTCTLRFKAGHCSTRYERFNDTLSRFVDMPLLEPLRELNNIINAENKISNKAIAQNFIIDYESIASRLNKAICTYLESKNKITEKFDATIDALITRITPYELPYRNVFTQTLMVTTKISRQAAQKLLKAMKESGQLNQLNKAMEHLIPSTELDENKSSPTVEKLSRDQMREIASLLHYQGEVMIMFNNLCDTAAAHANLRMSDACGTASDFGSHTLLPGQNTNSAAILSMAIHKATSQSFSSDDDELGRWLDLLAKNPYKELAPLQKALKLYKEVKSMSGTLEFNLVMLMQGRDNADKVFAESRKIVDLHNAMYNDISSLYNKIVSKLTKLKPARQWQTSKISGNHLPQKYCYKQPAIALHPTAAPAPAPTEIPLPVPNKPLEEHSLNIYALQEYFLRNSDTSHPVTFSQKIPSADKPTIADSFTID